MKTCLVGYNFKIDGTTVTGFGSLTLKYKKLTENVIPEIIDAIKGEVLKASKIKCTIDEISIVILAITKLDEEADK